MVKTLNLVAVADGREELFMARYERLRKWALHLSAGDQAAAEDLIQEAFVQFTLTGPDLRDIENLDAYLFGLLRILHLSQLRRSKNRARLLRMALDYDAAALGLRGADPREQLVMREQLQRVCRYACSRKEASKAGSVLLLRFFLGYYPGEIARVAACKRPAVEERLRVARAEARAFLDDAKLLRDSAADAAAAPCDLAQPVDEFLRDLRRRIYQSRRGDCLGPRRWEELYGAGSPLNSATLAHLASCPRCLDIVNELLGLPLLAERYPLDALGKDTGGRDGGDDDWPDGGRGGAETEVLRCRRRAREVFEHRPEQLRVAVNGYDLSSHRVSGRHSEQTLYFSEPAEFVEVFSEQGVRLLLLQVGEQPPGGPFRHHTRLALSEGRELEARLSLNYPASTLQVVYRDALWQPEGAPAVSLAEAAEKDEEAGSFPSVKEAARKGRRAGEGRKGLRDASGGLWGRLKDYRFWLRPGVVTVVLCLLCLTATLSLFRWQGATVSAAELLGRASAVERAAAVDKSFVSHRVFYLESPGARRRVEVWQSAARGVTVRRVYDERDELVIAERLGADGGRTVLTPGSEPSTRFDPAPSAADLLKAGASWRLNPSAETFLALTGGAEGAQLEEASETYTLSYRRASADATSSGVVEATLVIRKSDLRGVELRVIAAGAGGTVEYRLVEKQFSKQPAANVPDTVFGLDASRAAMPSVIPAAPREAESVSHSSSTADPRLAAPTASAELEVEVNYLLNGIRASLGDQVSVRRTPSGRLRVEALAETEARKAEILEALSPVVKNPAVEVDVSTVAEALRRRGGRGAAATSLVEIEVSEDSQGVDAELRRRFASRFGDGAGADEAIGQLSRRVLEHSRRAVQHAAALRKTAASFPPEKAGSLDAEARAKLLSIIESHVRGYEQSVRALRQEMLPLSPGGDGGAPAVSSEADPMRAVERLLQLSRANDEAVSSAFALSAEGQSLERVESARFWAALAEAEALARAIQRAYQR